MESKALQNLSNVESMDVMSNSTSPELIDVSESDKINIGTQSESEKINIGTQSESESESESTSSTANDSLLTRVTLKIKFHNSLCLPYYIIQLLYKYFQKQR